MGLDAPYFLSLGAGLNQVPLIKAAKSLGYEVIAVDQDLSAPGFSLSDIRIQESIMNYRKIHYKIATNIGEEQITGGYCASYGAALLSWGFLVERLNLHGLSRTHTESLIDKLNVRQRLGVATTFSQPSFMHVKKYIYRDQLDSLSYPLIIKTRRGYGKKNIFLAESYADVKRLLTWQKFFKSGINPSDILIEEFIDGSEIIVVGLVQDFEFHLVSISDKTSSSSPPYIDLKHQFPSFFQDQIEAITNIHQEIVDIFQISSTPLVSEFKIKDGKFYLIEVSPQIPGEFLGTFLIPEATGYNYYENLVRMAIHQPIEEVSYPKKLKPVEIQFFDHTLSKEEWQEKSNSASMSQILNESPQYPPRDNSDRFGVIGFSKGK